MRLLIWNLYHGRSRPPAGRSLLNEYAARIAAWEWDVALLQEVPPWWPPQLAQAAGARDYSVLTSRNSGLAVRRAVAGRNPDLLKANGGGANAILVRRDREVLEHRRQRLTWIPERRCAHGVRLADGWVVNLHASVRPRVQIPRDVERAARAASSWAGDAPVLLGGDFNVRDPRAAGFTRLAGSWVDHLLARGWLLDRPLRVLDAGALSDHKPLEVAVRRADSPLA